ncbi:hypothetical protein GJ744_006937 [Endocarpon pusillum]|uniref:Uncharacterized protein n=1 Tax=Endocarpon pusillum TaxID=364733 RepID=A0A8H7ANC0_9EURO|nr:hypothetical protein GJ744_006937 [Endocarpon pusillum]
MTFASLDYQQHLTTSPQNRASTSPLAFLDDPFHSYTSAFLFFSTIILASLLIFHLMRYHYRRAKEYSSACLACAQIQAESGATTSQNPQARDIAHTGLDSALNRWPRRNEAAPPSSESLTGNLFDQGDGNYHYGPPTITPSSTFYTPLSRSTTVPSNVYQGLHCDLHSASGSITDLQDSGFTNTSLDGVGGEQSERNRVSRWWPVALQQVVVGDVKESSIAKRRSTLKRED